MRNYKNFYINKNKHKRLFPLLISFCFLLLYWTSAHSTSGVTNSDRFNRVKDVIFSVGYANRPNYQVTRKLFGKAGNNENNKLFQAAKRSLNETKDLFDFPAGQKLFNANGICFAGTWQIDSFDLVKNNNHFTGLFSPLTTEPVIVRASVALSGTKQKDKRAFGMAIKFFPKGYKTSLNAFVLNSFGGVRNKHVLNFSLDNEPRLGSLPKLSDVRTALRIKKELEKADRESGAKKPKYAFRPITHLAGGDSIKNTNSPKWLRLSPLTKERVDADDFRDELAINNYTQKQIVYTIQVAADAKNKSKAQWQTIGKLLLEESVTSAACDQRLHFQHPKLQKNSSNN